MLVEAQRLLKGFDCFGRVEVVTVAEREALRQALLLVAKHSDYQILGICADSIAGAKQALETYAQALGYTPDLNVAAVEGATYLKFNPNTGLCYASPYDGEYRGVLVSCQSADADDINEMYGHLPIDLFNL